MWNVLFKIRLQQKAVAIAESFGLLGAQEEFELFYSINLRLTEISVLQSILLRLYLRNCKCNLSLGQRTYQTTSFQKFCKSDFLNKVKQYE